MSEPTVQLAKQKVMEFGYMMAKFQSSDYVRPVTSLMEKYGVALVYEPTGRKSIFSWAAAATSQIWMM